MPVSNLARFIAGCAVILVLASDLSASAAPVLPPSATPTQTVRMTPSPPRSTATTSPPRATPTPSATPTIPPVVSGVAWSWGSDPFGLPDRLDPRPVLGLEAARAVAVGSLFNTAITANGELHMWPTHDSFEASTGQLVPALTSFSVPGIGRVGTVSPGLLHIMALDESGSLWTWGDNSSGQLGYAIGEICSLFFEMGSAPCARAPRQVPGLPAFRAISAGGLHSLALATDGALWSWGDNSGGQLGGPAADECDSFPGPCRRQPTQVADLTNIVAISAGSGHSLALHSDGTVWAWGDNRLGQLGSPSTDTCTAFTSIPGDCSFSPIRVQISGIQAIAAGANHSLVLSRDGTVWTWGDGGDGARIHGSCLAAANFQECPRDPRRVSGLSNIVAIAAGSSHDLALGRDGTVFSWGRNTFGQLGDGSTTDRATIQAVPGMSGAVSISAGGAQSAALFSAR